MEVEPFRILVTGTDLDENLRIKQLLSGFLVRIVTVGSLRESIEQANQTWKDLDAVLFVLKAGEEGDLEVVLSELENVTAAPGIVILPPDRPQSLKLAAQAGAEYVLDRKHLSRELLKQTVEFAVARARRTQPQVREPEFRPVLELTRTGYWQITPEGKTVYMNPAMRAMLELSAETPLEERSYDEFFVGEPPARLREKAKKPPPGKPLTYQAWIRGERGTHRRVLVSERPQLGPDRQVKSITALFTDLSLPAPPVGYRPEELRPADLRELLESTVSLVKTSLQVECCRVVEFREERSVIRAGDEWTIEEVLGLEGKGEAEDKLPPALEKREVDLVSGTSVIIRVTGRPFGALQVYRLKGPALTESEIDFLRLVAGLLGQVIRYDRLIRGMPDWRAVAHSWPLPCYGLDLRGRVFALSPAAEELLGWREKELAGSPPPFLSEEERKRHRRMLEREAGVEEAGPREVQLLRRDGSPVSVLLQTVPLRDDQGQLEGTLNQILRPGGLLPTERLQVDAVPRLLRRLVDELADRFSVIERESSDILQGALQQESLVGRVQRVRRALRKCHAILSALERLSSPVRPETVDVNDLLSRLLPSLKELAGDATEVRVELGEGPSSVRVDENWIKLVLLEAVKNSCAAMPDGGLLKIRTQVIPVTKESPPVAGMQPGLYLALEVSDTGQGMDPQVEEKALEPFFTTREEAAGLGLAMADAVTRQAGGFLRLESRRDQGSRLTLYLPVSSSGPEA